ncbi:CLIP domain-containing serine protease HP8-like [Hetaerina americana]|uniref:CLIP domain-containing serine protease HP8-like n=1 Tax=Hetaerina americana TaxID=62018 RepID=UPI003A7F3C48
MFATNRGILAYLPIAVLLILWPSGHAQNSRQLGGNCRTPNRQDGRCISVDTCEALRPLLSQRPLSTQTVNFLRQSQCGFQRNRPYVCCPNSGSAQTGGVKPNANDLFGVGNRPVSTPATPTGSGSVTSNSNVANHPNWRYLRTDTCGADVNDRIFGGEEAHLKEYPWLALLEYQTQSGRQFLCGGSLISTRYVLTAAHCVTGIGRARLVGVRLGEHDTDTNPDCVNYEDGRVCGDPVQDFNVAEVIVHPQYQSQSRDKHHDIALIRLDRAAPITDYILPVCIPNGAALNKRYETESLIVAGWGKTENKTASNVKLWVRVPAVTNTACAPVYQRQITLGPNQMCAGGQQGKDSCRGDSGGPLMAVDSVVPARRGGQWVVVGVVSIGPNICATAGRPGIYTRVGPYVGWILDSLKA